MTKLQAIKLLNSGQWTWADYSEWLRSAYPDKNVWVYTGKGL